jgi:sugar-specific transcriptional regulator TrmB
MDFSALGLSTNEEKIYTTLIKLGKSSASELSREGEVPYGKIYEVLARLEQKGLVQIIPEQTKKFKATSPEVLINIINKKEEEFKKLKEEANKLKKFYEFDKEEPVQIARGLKNFYKILKHSPEAEQFSYSIKWSSEYKPQHILENKKLIKKGIKPKVLARINEETKENINKWLKHYKEIKKIENEGVAIDINDKHVLIILIKQNTIIEIKDKAFSNIMKQLFEKTYDNTKELTKEDLK